ncbi:hypothetical protein PtA15_16A119 [Puccinia triticina]|uniref:Uncharacterized protein n=1 Tax=Puccinia triticina TaxID=208348 RepID=A0ABY7D3M2_9BASI|nr:uncharacterized protein PtA15_16A119 [Puccinia triticina]WAQ92213.1 hypothetical protein PtA15_16A119 [Puccinia triticina]
MQSNQPNYGYSNFDQLHVEKNGFGQERQIQYGYPSFESSDNYDQGQNFTQFKQRNWSLGPARFLPIDLLRILRSPVE